MLRRRLCSTLLLGAAACGGLPEDTLLIERIEVSGVQGDQVFAENLEVEVHVYERTLDGRRYLGCAGEDTGLEQVDLPNTEYYPEAYFVRRNGSNVLRLSELPDEIFFVVTEDDSLACPVEQSADAEDFTGGTRSNQDDLAGISPDVATAALYERKVLDFSGARLVLRPLALTSRR